MIETKLRLIEQVTWVSAQRVNDLVFRYGHLLPQDPERDVLSHQVAQVLAEWASTMLSLGAVPHDLWTVVVEAENGPVVWRLPSSELRCNLTAS